MLTIRRLFVCLGLVFFFGSANACATMKQVFSDGTWIEYDVAGDPLRFTDTSGKVFVKNTHLSMQQVFDILSVLSN